MNWFAAAVDTADLGTIGVPGLVVIIVVLAGVILYRERYWTQRDEKKQDKLDAIQEERLTQAIETRDKIAEPLQNMTTLMQTILNAVTNGKR